MASAKAQASVAIGLAALLGIGWAVAGTPLRIRWIVARGAPPAPQEFSDAAEQDLRVLGVPARATLLDLFRGEGTRARRSWVASILLRAPFFAQEEIEKGLASPDPLTARAAAFALLEGEEDVPRDDSGVTIVKGPGEQPTPRAPLFRWDPAPAIPVLTAWVADRTSLEAVLAAKLLGRIPPGDPRVTEALLRVVDEVPEILGKDAPPDLRLRGNVVKPALQALLPRAGEDPALVARVAKVVAWIQENHLSERSWEIQSAALQLAEASRGRGMPEGLFALLAEDPNPIVRQRLAGTLEEVPGGEATRILERLSGAAEPVVRRAAVLALVKRRDPVLFRLAPRLVEDSYVYIASDALRGLGDMWKTEPVLCREAVPFLVSRIEDPWPGEGPAPAARGAEFIEPGRIDIIEAAVLSLNRITHVAPGFGGGAADLLDRNRRGEICRVLAVDPAKRKAIADEWHKTVPPLPPGSRIPPLVEMLEAKDEDNVVRAMRELSRTTGESTGFPSAAMQPAGDDSTARNAVRDWRKTPEFGRAIAAWKARLPK